MRELTKKYEQRRKDTIQGHIAYYTQNVPKGEFVLAIEGVSLEEQNNNNNKIIS